MDSLASRARRSISNGDFEEAEVLLTKVTAWPRHGRNADLALGYQGLYGQSESLSVRLASIGIRETRQIGPWPSRQ